jgi:hypothetical protein
MSDLELLDRGYATILRQVIDNKAAPHYTELAAQLDISIDAAKDLTHELMGMTPGWVHPGTDYIASFPPFNLQPTQYKVTIDGEAGWYAQCGFEALAIRWLVPGQEVCIEAPCLCCGEPVTVTMQDDDYAVDPSEAVGYTISQVGGDAASRPFR